MAATPEVTAILQQVETELTAMLLAGETGTVTVHCGVDQLVVKANPERKHEPVRLERSRMNVIRRPR
jgi:hypothetical protein